MSQLHLISRYTGVRATEHRCTAWAAASGTRPKRKAAAQVRDAAAELLSVYARRAARQAMPFRYAPRDYERLPTTLVLKKPPTKSGHPRCDSRHDQPLPMDRLVCGDVGFGKTEVALRAAFVAVTGGRQSGVFGAHHTAG